MKREVMIRGVTYKSIESAAQAHGVSRKRIVNGINEGTLDTVGMRKMASDKLASMFPLNIRGDTFQSVAEISERFGACEKSVRNVLMYHPHKIQNIGLGKDYPRQIMRVMIRGKVFESAEEAALYHGVSVKTVRAALWRGTHDNIGIGSGNYRTTDGTALPTTGKPITISGMRFQSIAHASRTIGVCPHSLRRYIKDGNKAWIEARGQEYLARVDAERKAANAKNAWLQNRALGV